MRYSIQEALDYAIKALKIKDRPRLEAEILLSFVLGVERVFLHVHTEKLLHQEEFKKFQALILRAQNHEPIEYLTQRVSFYGYEWEISQGVLIPRPETELLIEYAGEIIKHQGIKRVFEFGVGSGVISIMLALLHPQIVIQASEINPLAIELTRKNIQRFLALDPTLSHRIMLIQGDVLKKSCDVGHFDLLVSNPPYIASSYPLPPNVAYEPKEALFGGEEGDEILSALVDFAKEQGFSWMVCEMGFDQKKIMLDRLNGCESVSFYQDLSGLDRGFSAKL